MLQFKRMNNFMAFYFVISIFENFIHECCLDMLSTLLSPNSSNAHVPQFLLKFFEQFIFNYYLVTSTIYLSVGLSICPAEFI